MQPDAGCEDAVEVERRRALLKLMSPSMFTSVHAEVEGWWKAEKEGIPTALLSHDRLFVPIRSV